MTNTMKSFAAVAALLVGTTGAMAQQEGLVNLSVDGNTVQVPVDVAANVCGVDVNVIAEQTSDGGTACEIDQKTAAQEGINTGAGGEGSSNDNNNGQQNGLVNVSVDGNTVQVPIGVAANICDVSANVIAEQSKAGDFECEVSQETAAENGIGNFSEEGDTSGTDDVEDEVEDTEEETEDTAEDTEEEADNN